MKRKQIRYYYLITLLMFLCPQSNIFGQKIIECGKDTFITISPQNLATINSIIVERDYLQEELEIMISLNNLKDLTIADQKEIIKSKEESINQSKKYNSLVLQDKEFLWKKRTITWAGISATFGLILGILIAL